MIYIATIDKMLKSGRQQTYLEKIVMSQIIWIKYCSTLRQSLFEKSNIYYMGVGHCRDGQRGTGMRVRGTVLSNLNLIDD